ncbi:MAG TPA: bidirectional hydrogenase complex protein HoxE [Polyangiaceae bacterium]|nr:bidirectional hydrogenase complex protein HoxE [Polyangiaceae bacterium]
MAQPQRAPAATKHPSGDRRFEMLDTSMKRLRFQPDSLIEILHTAQELFGHLRPDLLMYVARGLKLPPSRVYGVATFYHLFSFAPQAEHSCVVCTGTACYVKGADAILPAVEKQLGIRAGRSTADGKVSLSIARCLGACGLAPIVVYDGQVAAHQSEETSLQTIQRWYSNGPR